MLHILSFVCCLAAFPADVLAIDGSSAQTFDWLWPLVFSEKVPPTMFRWLEFSPEAFNALSMLVSSSSAKDASVIRAACSAFKCNTAQRNQFKNLRLGVPQEGWAFVRWGIEHFASGLLLAESAVHYLAALGTIQLAFKAGVCLHTVAQRGIPIPTRRSFDAKYALMTLIGIPASRPSMLGWLDSFQAQIPTSLPALDKLVFNSTLSFAKTVRNLDEGIGELTLPLPIVMLEARRARVFHAILSSLAREELEVALNTTTSAGLSPLHQAALSDALAHVIVIQHHARRAAFEGRLFSERAGAEGPVALRGLNASQIAAKAGNCAVWHALNNQVTGKCPQRKDEASPHPAGSNVQPLAGVTSWAAPRPTSLSGLTWCGIPSRSFSAEIDWTAVLSEHAFLQQPLRITGVGQALEQTDSSMFDFGSLANLCQPPWADVHYEVGVTPYAREFSGKAPRIMKLCSFAQDINRSVGVGQKTRSRDGEKYWFSEHYPKDNANNVDVKDQTVNGRLDQVRKAITKVIGQPFPANITHGEGDSVKFILGAAMSGAPVHIHSAAVNIALMGTRRWLLPSQRDGIWSQDAIGRWWRRSSKKARSVMRECVQHPGDLIFIPSFYPHGVLNTGPTLALSWTGEDAGLIDMQLKGYSW